MNTVMFSVIALIAVVMLLLMPLGVSDKATRVWNSLERRFTQKAVVLDTKGCIGFKEIVFSSPLAIILHSRRYWRTAALIQHRCAESGHMLTCVRCGETHRCSVPDEQRECDLAPNGAFNPSSEYIPRLMRGAAMLNPKMFGTVIPAVEQTEEIDDVLDLFIPHAKSFGMLYVEFLDPQSYFYIRCRELVKEEYTDLPFAIKWGFAQNAAQDSLQAA